MLRKLALVASCGGASPQKVWNAYATTSRWPWHIVTKPAHRLDCRLPVSTAMANRAEGNQHKPLLSQVMEQVRLYMLHLKYWNKFSQCFLISNFTFFMFGSLLLYRNIPLMMCKNAIGLLF